MTNRINELERNYPLTKEKLDLLINSVASHSNIVDNEKDEILSKHIEKLNKVSEYLLNL